LNDSEAIAERLAQAEKGVVCASRVKMKPVKWLWKGYVPSGKLTLLDGDPGKLKTTLLLDLVARVTRGHPMPCEPANGHDRIPGTVLYLSAEDDAEDTLKPRLMAAGADSDLVIFEAGWTPSLPGDAAVIGELARKLAIRLVVFDPAVAYLDREYSYLNDQHVRGALAELRSELSRSNLTTIGIRHFTKEGKGKLSIHRGGGSVGLIGAARAGLLVADHPDLEDALVLAVSKLNVGEKGPALVYRPKPVVVAGEDGERIETVSVEWGGEAEGIQADDLMVTAEALQDRRGDARRACADWLKKRLAGGVAVARQTLLEEAKAEDWSRSVLDRARTDAGVEIRPMPKAGGGSLWSLK